MATSAEVWRSSASIRPRRGCWQPTGVAVKRRPEEARERPGGEPDPLMKQGGTDSGGCLGRSRTGFDASLLPPAMLYYGDHERSGPQASLVSVQSAVAVAFDVVRGGAVFDWCLSRIGAISAIVGHRGWWHCGKNRRKDVVRTCARGRVGRNLCGHVAAICVIMWQLLFRVPFHMRIPSSLDGVIDGIKLAAIIGSLIGGILGGRFARSRSER